MFWTDMGRMWDGCGTNVILSIIIAFIKYKK